MVLRVALIFLTQKVSISRKQAPRIPTKQYKVYSLRPFTYGAVLIDPITIVTTGGYLATITSIDPFDYQACLLGRLVSKGAVSVTGWNEFGTASNRSDRANIVIGNDERLVDLVNMNKKHRMSNSGSYDK